MRGATLVEMLVGISLLGLMMATVLLVYVSGGRMLAKGSVQTEMLADLQTATSRLGAALQRSAYDGLSVELYSLSCLSATNAEGKVTVDDGRLQWNHYQVYFRDPARQTLMRRDVPLAPAAPPVPLAMASYLSGGSVVARHVADLQFRADGRLVHISVTAGTIVQEVTARVRN